MIDLGILIIGGEIQSNEIASTPETNVEELIVLLIEHAKEPAETESGSISQQICRLIAQGVIKNVLRSAIEYGNENPNCAFLFSKVADTINSAESDPFRRRTSPFLSESITDTMLNLYSTEIVLKGRTLDRPDNEEFIPKSKTIPDYVYGYMYQITSKILSDQNQYSRMTLRLAGEIAEQNNWI